MAVRLRAARRWPRMRRQRSELSKVGGERRCVCMRETITLTRTDEAGFAQSHRCVHVLHVCGLLFVDLLSSVRELCGAQCI